MTVDTGSALSALTAKLRRYAEAMFPAGTQADDVVGQAIAAVRGAGGGRPCEVKSFAALRSLCRDRQDAATLEPAAWKGQPVDGVPFAGARQSEILVRRNFERLPLDEREVLLLVCVEGFNYGKAAEILGVTKEAVAERLARARFRLHRMVAVGAEPPDLEPRPRTGVKP
jgi:RNA polymerase sigma-70 factor (ECF subfamily)